MVAANPIFVGGSFSRKFQATILNDIWPEVLFFSLIATMVTLVSKFTSVQLSISSAMLTVLGTVLGLVISFRTSTAYERFSEGRKLWTSIAISARILAQVIWIHVPFERTNKDTKEKMSHLQVVIEKKSMINLIQAYPVAVKHMLRGEAGVYYADLYPLISILPRFSAPVDKALKEDMLPLWRASGMDDVVHRSIRQQSFSSTSDATPNGSDSHVLSIQELEKTDSDSQWNASRRTKNASKFDPELALPVIPSEQPLLPARIPPKTSLFDYFGFLRIFSPIVRPILKKLARGSEVPGAMSARGRTITGKRIQPKLADSNVPVEIALYLNTYFTSLMREGLLAPASATAMNNAITSLQDTVVNLERIKNTPLPFAYQAHLRMSLWLYLFFLPFQIYPAFGWPTIPATALASFLLCGFLEIGQEIENPFNYHLNDLDLDHFCLAIERDLHEVTAHTIPDPDSFIFTEWNQPFTPADRRNAKEMLDDKTHVYHHPTLGVHHVQRTLLKNWSDVDQITRKQ